MQNLRKTFVNLGEMVMEKKLEFRRKREKTRQIKRYSKSVVNTVVFLAVFSGMGFVSYKVFHDENRRPPAVYTALEDQTEIKKISACIEVTLKDYVSGGKKFSPEKLSGISPQITAIWNSLFQDIANPGTAVVLNVKSISGHESILKAECVAGENGRFVFTLRRAGNKFSVIGIDRLRS
ncbi:MAG: hypothetical protein A2017_08420 [Lentisphaerae bacterium GWF2_44_16]|nr:MAG: hypothetical protein A2017_08420 [Lentisphaerae bacterium GWF2_44_16]